MKQLGSLLWNQLEEFYQTLITARGSTDSGDGESRESVVPLVMMVDAETQYLRCQLIELFLIGCGLPVRRVSPECNVVLLGRGVAE